jgi:hypothetical protein
LSWFDSTAWVSKNRSKYSRLSWQSAGDCLACFNTGRPSGGSELMDVFKIEHIAKMSAQQVEELDREFNAPAS